MAPAFTYLDDFELSEPLFLHSEYMLSGWW